MGSRVVPTTATPNPRWFNTNKGTGRSTIRSSDRSECRHTDRTGKQNNKRNNAEVTPQRACDKPNRTNPWIQPVKGATSGNLPITGEDMLHALPLRWPDHPALPPRSAPGASLSTVHARMLSFCVYHSARLVSCRACGDDLECCWSVRAIFTCVTSFCVHVWKTARFFSVVLSCSSPFCPLLPRFAQYCPVLPRTAPYCPEFPFPVPCCGHPCG